MYYTEEQFNALTPIADELRRAIDHNYAHNPGAKTLDAIREAYISASGTKRYPRNWGCSACVVQLMKDAGRLYFADLDERNAAALEAANAAAAAEATKEAAKDVIMTDAGPISTPSGLPSASIAKTAANGESTEEAAGQETAPTEAGSGEDSSAKTEAEETTAEVPEAAETAPKSKSTKTAKK